MKILMITETLSVGGAETFAVRLANALSVSHKVYLINLHPDLSRNELVARLEPSVIYLQAHHSLRMLLQKADGLMLRLKINNSLTDHWLTNFILSVINKYKPDVIHSHLFKPDYYAAILKSQGLYSGVLVSTNHGDYIEYDKISPVRILDYKNKKKLTLSMLNYMAVISDAQLNWINGEKKRLDLHLQHPKILNGYECHTCSDLTREEANIPANAFVYGMVARGIKPKGWTFLLKAFVQLNDPDSHLVLVGEGEEITTLQNTYKKNSNIHFIGFTDQPVSWIRLFDVGVLPSVLKSESLPTVVIEYLYCGKPVIATDVGEIRNMISVDSKIRSDIAGIIIPTADDVVDITLLVEALRRMKHDDKFYRNCQENTIAAFAKFSMATCIHKYENIYTNL